MLNADGGWLQQPACEWAQVAWSPSTTILLGVLRVNILLLLLLLHMLLLIMLDCGWRCRCASSHARHVSLGHAIAFSVVEVLIRGDWGCQDAGGDLLHVASLLRCLRTHEL